MSAWRFTLPIEAPTTVVAVFDRTADTQEILEQAFVAVGMRVHHMSPESFALPAAVIREELETGRVTVVIWDISPALSFECAAFEALFYAGAFGECLVVLTTTNAAALQRHQSPICAQLALLQKPYDIALLLDALVPGVPLRSGAEP